MPAEVWALPIGAALITISGVYGPDLWWEGGWVRQSSMLLEHVPNDVTGLRGLVGKGGGGGKRRWAKGGNDIITQGLMELYAIAAGLSGAVYQTPGGHHYLRHISESDASGEKHQHATTALIQTNKRKQGYASLDGPSWSLRRQRNRIVCVCLTDKEWIITLATGLTNVSAVDRSDNRRFICISSLGRRTKMLGRRKPTSSDF